MNAMLWRYSIKFFKIICEGRDAQVDEKTFTSKQMIM